MSLLKYKDYSTEELFAELKHIIEVFENEALSRVEYNKLKRDEEDIIKELRSRGYSVTF